MRLDFIKGHMGGNTILFIYGDQVPRGREIEVSVALLDPLYLSAHEIGILYPPGSGGDICVKIVGFTSRRFITACGGVTQVLGKALIEAGVAARFGIPVSEPLTRVVLETDAGPAELQIRVSDGQCLGTVTSMDAFVRECYERGVYRMDLAGVEAMRVGKFLVLNANNVREKHPEADFERMDEDSKRVLLELQDQFKERVGRENLDFAVYDWRPGFSGDVRAVFPHNFRNGHIEPACGTGTVAIGIVCLESGELEAHQKSPAGGRASLVLETGGGPTLVGPDRTEISMVVESGRVKEASFSHSLVEVIANGTALLP